MEKRKLSFNIIMFFVMFFFRYSDYYVINSDFIECIILYWKLFGGFDIISIRMRDKILKVKF